MNFKKFIYASIIAASLNLTEISANPLIINGYEIPKHLTDKARDILDLSKDILYYQLTPAQFTELMQVLSDYEAVLHGQASAISRKRWLEIQNKKILS